MTAEVKAVTDAVANPDSPATYTAAPGGTDTLSTAIRGLNTALLTQLQPASVLAKAYSLGQTLSSFSSTKDSTQFDNALNAAAIVTANRQLNDLATVLPAHAAKSVSQSLTWWRDVTAISQRGGAHTALLDTIGRTRTDAPSLRRSPQSNGPKIRRAPEKDGLRDDLVAALPRQAELWRTVLVGEKNPLDLLTPEDYLDAGRKLFGRARDLIKKIPVPAAIAVLLVTAIFFGIAALAIWWPHASGDANGTARFTVSFTATFATIAAWIGALWKGVLPRLKSVMTSLEKPLWGAALDVVIAEAISIPPVGASDGERWSVLAKVAREATTGR